MAKSDDVLDVTSEEWETFFYVVERIVNYTGEASLSANEKGQLVVRMAAAKGFDLEFQEFISWEFEEIEED
jgi:hypothetical protein